MNNLNDIRTVMSPNAAYNAQSQNSIMSRGSGYGIEPTQLDFKTSKVESKFANISMIQSQVMNNSGSGFYNNAKSSAVVQRYAPSSSRSIDPMKESTMNYVRNVYKAFGNISDDRLRQISQNFMRLYGTDRQITQNGLRNIQREAHLNQQFQQTRQTVQGLLNVLDSNRDNRITQEDIMVAARRYLTFEKKPIVYTPMVEERLAVARRLFKQFDVQRKGYLTQKQVPNLLNQTYKCLGKTFTATPQDVKSWLKLTDADGDGRVTLPEYEHSIIRALKKQGVRIYEQ